MSPNERHRQRFLRRARSPYLACHNLAQVSPPRRAACALSTQHDVPPSALKLFEMSSHIRQELFALHRPCIGRPPWRCVRPAWTTTRRRHRLCGFNRTGIHMDAFGGSRRRAPCQRLRPPALNPRRRFGATAALFPIMFSAALTGPHAQDLAGSSAPASPGDDETDRCRLPIPCPEHQRPTSARRSRSETRCRSCACRPAARNVASQVIS